MSRPVSLRGIEISFSFLHLVLIVGNVSEMLTCNSDTRGWNEVFAECLLPGSLFINRHDDYIEMSLNKSR
jgi:hypothetical protein